ncbi:phosphoadenylyl-sulfate reductase [Zhengella sp. ZM62]|uniref:phosphoadenylyl-sulfate reductase n=1 Tax=Zhengella sedimenti TaxID=3390035 RepID=UPI0039747405
MLTKQRQPDPATHAAARAADFEARYADLPPALIVEIAARTLFPGTVTAVSSFGADSAVLLHMIAKVAPDLPVAFLDTGHHFGETIAYRDALLADLGLTNLQVFHPNASQLALRDPANDLHGRDTDTCCAIRKVEPMARAVEPCEAWFTGRKRFQAATRAALPVFEPVGHRIRVNPLAHMEPDAVRAYAERHGLRENPLVAFGYLSIGCFPCTQPVRPGDDARSGRWAGQSRTECGIHLDGLEQSLSSSEL